MEKTLPQRIEDLRNAVAWSKEHGGLTSGQCICIHQEIAALLKEVEAGQIYFFPYMTILGRQLQEKVTHITNVIRNSRWIKQECKY